MNTIRLSWKDLILTGGQSFSGILKSNAGTAAFYFPERHTFLQDGFLINSKSDGTGVNITGFALEEENEFLSDKYGKKVYEKIKITDITWQSGNIYFFGKYAGDVVDVESYNKLIKGDFENNGIHFLTNPEEEPLVDSRAIEYKSAPITSSGWWTLFESDEVENRGKSFEFEIVTSGSGSRREVIRGRVSYISENSARAHKNTLIEIYRDSDAAGKFLQNLRLITSAVATSGAKLQAYFNVSTTVFITYKIKNNLTQVATADSFGWVPVPPLQETTPNLPNGTPWASAIVLCAGEEKILVDTALTFPAEGYYIRVSDNIFRCTVPWEDTPFWATALTLNIVTTFDFHDSSGNSSTVSSYSISDLAITKKGIQFSLNQTGIGTSFDAGGLVLKVAGVDTKYILS
jgi:hypothetical protein